MRKILLGLTLAALVSVLPAAAQKGSSDNAPRIDLSLDYTYLYARTVPSAGCCFSMNGGSVSFAYNPNNWLGLVGDFGWSYTGNVQGSGSTLSLFTYNFGPRFSWRNSSRFTPYGQFLIGSAHAGGTIYTVNFFPPGTKNAFATELGGGLDIKVGKHWSIRAVQAEWMYSQLPNGALNYQHNLRISAGVVLHFKTH